MATLHFVYNVDATPGALLRDFVHRLVDPATYPCRLCDLTYGRLIKKAEWSRFVAGLPVRARFHLRGSFWQRFPEYRHEPLPAVFVEESPGALRTLISAGIFAVSRISKRSRHSWRAAWTCCGPQRYTSRR